MKLWGIVCTLLSGGLFALMLLSMHSCAYTYEIDGAGKLLSTKTDNSKTPPVVTRTPCDWNTSLPEFPTVERWTQPGDQLLHTRTTGGFWAFEVEMHLLEITRGQQCVLRVRSGHVRFWSVLLGLSLFPLICYGIAAIWVVCVPSQRQRSPLS